MSLELPATKDNTCTHLQTGIIIIRSRQTPTMGSLTAQFIGIDLSRVAMSSLKTRKTKLFFFSSSLNVV